MVSISVACQVHDVCEIHPICDPCWLLREPHRNPYRVTDRYRETEPCCFCGDPTHSGIYVHDNPNILPLCRGHNDN